MGTFANSEDPDEMQHNAAFHQGLHCLLGLKQPLETEIHHNLENSTCDPLKYTMDCPILIVSIYMGKSIRIQRVNSKKTHPADVMQDHFWSNVYVISLTFCSLSSISPFRFLISCWSCFTLPFNLSTSSSRRLHYRHKE